MSLYRDPKPAYRAYIRDWKQKEEQRRAADLRPAHEILAEISAKHHRPDHRPADTRTDAQCYEDLKNFIAANPLSAEELADDRRKEKERLRAIDAPARARRAKVRAKATAKRGFARAEAKAWRARMSRLSPAMAKICLYGRNGCCGGSARCTRSGRCARK